MPKTFGRKWLGCEINNNRGAVLIMTLFVISLVTVLVLDYHLDTSVEVELTENYANQVRAYHLALAGLQFAQAVLEKDDSDYDAADELWHNMALFGCVPPEQLIMLVQAAAGGEVKRDDEPLTLASSKSAEGVEAVTSCVKLSIVDETGKLPLNVLVDTTTDAIREEWRAVFEIFFIEFEIDTDVIDALIDWIDLSPGHLAGGAEDEYYEGLTPPYKSPDRPIEVPGDLRLIRHFTCENLAKLFPEKECKNIPDIDLGTNEYLTPYGGGSDAVKININTAHESVIRAISQGDATCVEDIMSKRIGLEGQVVSEPIQDLSDLCSTVPDFDNFAGTRSTHFRIESQAEIDGLIKQKIVAVLERNVGRGLNPRTAGPPITSNVGVIGGPAEAFKMVYFKIE